MDALSRTSSTILLPLIGLINGHGKVLITESTFDGFSNWGSIIRDTRELPSLDYTKSQGIISVSYRDSMKFN